MNFFKKSYRSETEIKSYHVHLYYDGSSKQHAANLRRQLDKRFGERITIGRWRDKAPQGPHPVSHFQVDFPIELFNTLVPFLALNRGDLHILLHPNTGNGYEDHTQNVMWIGSSIPLSKDWLERK
ncbi:MAG: DOPA 4,5-dioxygenase family protein [Pseudomonadota bacterium]|nr:DOPA 4,5-dioxygenase family protein [Pseudomonadota bacterium]